MQRADIVSIQQKEPAVMYSIGKTQIYSTINRKEHHVLVARKETRYTPEEHIYDWKGRNGLTISSTQWARSEKDLLPNL